MPHSKLNSMMIQFAIYRESFLMTALIVLSRDAMRKHCLRRRTCGVCPSVCPFAMFVDSVKTNKHIFSFFHRRICHTSLVFPYQTSWKYSDGDPLTGASNAGGVGRHKSRLLPTNSCLSFDDCCSANNKCDRPACSLPHRRRRVSGSVYHNQHGRPRRREQNIIYLYAALSLKRNLRSTYCSIEATDRHEASRGLSATAGLLVLYYCNADN